MSPIENTFLCIVIISTNKKLVDRDHSKEATIALMQLSNDSACSTAMIKPQRDYCLKGNSTP